MQAGVTLALVCVGISPSFGAVPRASDGGSRPIGYGSAMLFDTFAGLWRVVALVLSADYPVPPGKGPEPFGGGRARIDDAPSGIDDGPSWSARGLVAIDSSATSRRVQAQYVESAPTVLAVLPSLLVAFRAEKETCSLWLVLLRAGESYRVPIRRLESYSMKLPLLRGGSYVRDKI